MWAAKKVCKSGDCSVRGTARLSTGARDLAYRFGARVRAAGWVARVRSHSVGMWNVWQVCMHVCARMCHTVCEQ